MRNHKHRARPDRYRMQAFRGSVKPFAPEPMAHGGFTIVDFCRCGAERKTNINGKHVERGPWEDSANA